MAAVDLVGAVGGDDDHSLLAEARLEEGEERARRSIRPVDVLEPEHRRVVPAELLEQAQEGVEEAALRLPVAILATLARGVAELGSEAGELGPGGVGDLAEDGVAVAGQWGTAPTSGA